MSKYDYAMDVLTWEKNKKILLLKDLKGNVFHVEKSLELEKQIAELESAIEVLRRVV